MLGRFLDRRDSLSKPCRYFPRATSLECCWISRSPTSFASGDPWRIDCSRLVSIKSNLTIRMSNLDRNQPCRRSSFVNGYRSAPNSTDNHDECKMGLQWRPRLGTRRLQIDYVNKRQNPNKILIIRPQPNFVHTPFALLTLQRFPPNSPVVIFRGKLDRYTAFLKHPSLLFTIHTRC